jgi:hypothetical protein
MQHDTLNDSLTRIAFEFFFWYSRFEAALKENGYLKSKKPGVRADPDWDAFIKEWHGKYSPSDDALRLVKLAPKTQVVDQHGGLVWLDTPITRAAPPLKVVITMLKAVRNNLFHGGKKGGDTWDDPRRTRELLEVARPILDELAELGGFKTDFHQTY